MAMLTEITNKHRMTREPRMYIPREMDKFYEVYLTDVPNNGTGATSCISYCRTSRTLGVCTAYIGDISRYGVFDITQDEYDKVVKIYRFLSSTLMPYIKEDSANWIPHLVRFLPDTTGEDRMIQISYADGLVNISRTAGKKSELLAIFNHHMFISDDMIPKLNERVNDIYDKMAAAIEELINKYHLKENLNGNTD